MKFTFALVFFLCYTMLSSNAMSTEKSTVKPAVTASKELKDAIKTAKESKKMTKECLKVCPSSYEPICVHDPADITYKPRTFGNQCVLDNHNCEMATKLALKNKGECSGSEGIRL